MNKSFILYQEYKKHIDLLSLEQSGKLFKAIFDYNDGIEYDLEPIIKMAFSFIKADLDRNKEKYNNIVERNKINGSKGGRPSKDNKPTGLSGNQDKPKKADNDDVNVNDSESKNKNDSKNELPIFINKNLLDDFAEVRKKLKKPLTEKAKELVVKKLIEFESKQSGFANLALENSIENSWQGVFEPKNTSPNRPDSLAAKLNSIAGGDYFKSITLGDKAILNCNVGMKTKLYSLPEEIRQKIKDQFKQPIEIN